MDTKSAVTSLSALAQETRLAVFRLLVAHGPTGVSAGEIGAELKLAPATLSFHLKELAHAGLIQARSESRYIYYSANYGQMNALVAYLSENCCARDGVTCGVGASCAPKKAAPKRKGVKA